MGKWSSCCKVGQKKGVEACPIAYEVNRVLDDARNRALQIAARRTTPSPTIAVFCRQSSPNILSDDMPLSN